MRKQRGCRAAPTSPYSTRACARKRTPPVLPSSPLDDDLYLDALFPAVNPLDLLTANIEAGEFEEGSGRWDLGG